MCFQKAQCLELDIKQPALGGACSQCQLRVMLVFTFPNGFVLSISSYYMSFPLASGTHSKCFSLVFVMEGEFFTPFQGFLLIQTAMSVMY